MSVVRGAFAPRTCPCVSQAKGLVYLSGCLPVRLLNYSCKEKYPWGKPEQRAVPWTRAPDRPRPTQPSALSHSTHSASPQPTPHQHSRAHARARQRGARPPRRSAGGAAVSVTLAHGPRLLQLVALAMPSHNLTLGPLRTTLTATTSDVRQQF